MRDTSASGNYSDIQFRFDSVSGTPRVVLQGEPTQVLALVNAYYNR